MSNFFNNYIFPVCTVINIYTAFMLILSLFTPSATPLIAFMAIFYSIISILSVARIGVLYVKI
jgi:hypothetical protein